MTIRVARLTRNGGRADRTAEKSAHVPLAPGKAFQFDWSEDCARHEMLFGAGTG